MCVVFFFFFVGGVRDVVDVVAVACDVVHVVGDGSCVCRYDVADVCGIMSIVDVVVGVVVVWCCVSIGGVDVDHNVGGGVVLLMLA